MTSKIDNIIKAPQWLIDRMENLKNLPPPTLEEVRIQFESSAKVSKKYEDEKKIIDGYIEKLESFEKLPKNWDSYDADPIPSEIIKTCISVVYILYNNKVINISRISPCGDGTVLFQFNHLDSEYLIEVFDNEIICIIKTCNKKDILKEFNINNFHNGIEELFKTS